MKQTYLFCLLFVSLFSNAQIINFPDANFKAMLLAASPNNTIAIDINNNYIKIDTNNDNEIQISEALQVKYLRVDTTSSLSQITNLEGILNFTNLQTLKCGNNQITNLNLQGLNSLIKLDCYSNQISTLNIQGLTNLDSLNCSSNQLTNLNFQGLSNLRDLNCSVNQITNIDFTGLNLIKYIGCSYNQIASLNITNHNYLETLHSSDNLLTSLNLSNLPVLSEINAGWNQLTQLDLSNINSNMSISLVLTNNNLQSLDISSAKINPNGFTISGNTNITYLNIKDGQNSTAPFGWLWSTDLIYICADEEEIIPLYNYLDGTNPLCQINSYCSFTPGGEYYTIQGQQKFDNENDGCDSNDNIFPNFKFSVTNGTNSGQFISNNLGNYFIPVQAGQHTVTAVLENPTYFNVSPNPLIVDFPTMTSPVSQNFCITPNGIKHDIEVSIIPTNAARPGFYATYKILYKNKGNQTENGTINLQFDYDILDVVSTNPAFATQTLNNLNWTYTNLQPFETREINVVFNVNSPMESPAVNAGDFLIYIAEITQTGTDELPIDNTFGLKQIVVNSFDPNDKTCLQGNTIAPSEIGKYVHYMIRFENTGSFPAENIVVKDMIDSSKFDISSLVPLNASHNYITRISGNKVEFIFENINLPFNDATNDGYIAFKIKTLPSLVIGNTFSNLANIYFDYNFPIITNTATTTIAALINPNFEFVNYFSLYPNPAINELNINLKSAIEINSIQIYNTIGQLVTVQTGNALKVDVSNLKFGNYFIKINTNEGFSTSQFIKE
jgi:uncharacterized repeat protein (TIGR01451 family)